MHGMQSPDKDAERMALCKNSRISQTDTDTGRKRRAGKRHDTGYKNISGKGLKAEAKTNPGGRNRKRYPGNRDDLGHGTVGGRNGADKKGTLGG